VNTGFTGRKGWAGAAGSIAAASALGVGIAGSADADEDSFVVLSAATAGVSELTFAGIVDLRDGDNQEKCFKDHLPPQYCRWVLHVRPHSQYWQFTVQKVR